MRKYSGQPIVPKYIRINLIMILMFLSTVLCQIPEAHRKRSNHRKKNKLLRKKMQQLFRNSQRNVERFVHAMERKYHAIKRIYKDQHFYIHQLIHWIVASEVLTLSSFLINKALSSKLVQIIVRRTNNRMLKNVDPGVTAAKLLIGMNGFILALWQFAIVLKNEKLLHWMKLNFLCPTDNSLVREFPHTIVTSAFSHIDWNHFFSNMAVLWCFVPSVYRHFQSSRAFYYVYIASALASDLFNNLLFARIPMTLFSENSFVTTMVEMIYSEIVGSNTIAADWVRRNRNDPAQQKGKNNVKAEYSLGASGILSAMMTYDCLSNTHAKLKVDGIVLSAPKAAAMWALNDFIVLRHADGIGHGAHLGGAMFGAIVHIVRTHLLRQLKKDDTHAYRYKFRKS
jgi:membrane associated rhomboid family serine protease